MLQAISIDDAMIGITLGNREEYDDDVFVSAAVTGRGQ